MGVTHAVVGVGVIMVAACHHSAPLAPIPPAAAAVEAEPLPSLPIAARDPATASAAPSNVVGGDVDGDGIFDELDACPDEAETFNGIDDEDGCPDISCRLPVDANPSFAVAFEHGATVPAGARAGLADLARSLVQSGAVEVEVAGHTDSVGEAQSNERLARRRATAVRQLLIDGGVSPEVLRVVTHGEERPLAANETEAGRRRNRRVEITCVEGC